MTIVVVGVYTGYCLGIKNLSRQCAINPGVKQLLHAIHAMKTLTVQELLCSQVQQTLSNIRRVSSSAADIKLLDRIEGDLLDVIDRSGANKSKPSGEETEPREFRPRRHSLGAAERAQSARAAQRFRLNRSATASNLNEKSRKQEKGRVSPSIWGGLKPSADGARPRLNMKGKTSKPVSAQTPPTPIVQTRSRKHLPELPPTEQTNTEAGRTEDDIDSDSSIEPVQTVDSDDDLHLDSYTTPPPPPELSSDDVTEHSKLKSAVRKVQKRARLQESYRAARSADPESSHPLTAKVQAQLVEEVLGPPVASSSLVSRVVT